MFPLKDAAVVMVMVFNYSRRMVNHHPEGRHQTSVIFINPPCVCSCTESSGADVTGAEALQRHDEPGTPAGL